MKGKLKNQKKIKKTRRPGKTYGSSVHFLPPLCPTFVLSVCNHSKSHIHNSTHNKENKRKFIISSEKKHSKPLGPKKSKQNLLK